MNKSLEEKFADLHEITAGIGQRHADFEPGMALRFDAAAHYMENTTFHASVTNYESHGIDTESTPIARDESGRMYSDNFAI